MGKQLSGTTVSPRVSAIAQALEPARAIGHSGRSFLHHLSGTFLLLVNWRVPAHVQLAGLFHSAYSTSYFGGRLFDVANRNALMRLVGPRAEALIYHFCAIARRDAFWAKCLRSSQRNHFFYEDRFSGQGVTIDSRVLAELVLIESANIAEQSGLGMGPTPWMSKLSGWISLLGKQTYALLGCPSLSRRSDMAAIRYYERGLVTSGAVARRCFDRAIALNPWAAEPRILREACGSTGRRRERLRVAARLMHAWGVPWDKRLGVSDWLDFAERLCATTDTATEYERMRQFLTPPT